MPTKSYLLLFLLAAQAQAAHIDAPTTSPAYSLVRCHTSHQGAGFAWFVSGPTGFADSVVAEDGRLCAFTGPPGVYRVMLVVSHSGGKLEQGQATVTITDQPGPTPPDPKPPGPQPGPADRYGLAKLALESLAKVKQPAAERTKTAHALSKNFAAVATAIRAGTVSSLGKADEKVTDLNQTTLGTNRRIWHPWLLAVSDRFNQLEQSKEIATVQDKGDAFNEVAAGLGSVK
jgi:hypothetical protein